MKGQASRSDIRRYPQFGLHCHRQSQSPTYHLQLSSIVVTLRQGDRVFRSISDLFFTVNWSYGANTLPRGHRAGNLVIFFFPGTAGLLSPLILERR
jgi:hypothetical protein